MSNDDQTSSIDAFADHTSQLFATIQPSATLENDVIASIAATETSRRMRIPPAVRKAALAAAAVLVLGASGYFAQQWIEPAERLSRSPTDNSMPARRGSSASTGANDKDGQNVLYADARVDLGKNPYSGTQREHIYARKQTPASPANTPRDANDTVLLPVDDESRRTQTPAILGTRMTEAEARFDAGAFQILNDGKLDAASGDLFGAGQNQPSAAFDINSFYSHNRGRASESGVPALSVTNAPVQTFQLNGVQVVRGSAANLNFSGGTPAPDIGGVSIVGGTDLAYRLTQPEPGQSEPRLSGVDGLKQPTEPAGPRSQDIVDSALPPNAAQQNQNAQPKPAVGQFRKIIRSGEMEFEVESFDRSAATVNTVVNEENGFIATMDSARLENGKVRGQIVLRVPPERLDALVLKLRALGELKQQRIGSQDVSKQYTDLESELRAARAMEERLINIIRTGDGAIKDLLAAEKELGTWRTKIEKIVGEMRYFDNLVAMSTLNLTLAERDVKAASAAVVTETISAGLEVDDVEVARRNALSAIDEAKGRVLQSELKQHEAGQWSASIIAEVSPDSAGALIDRFKQLGKVARLEADRKQCIEGNAPAGANLKTEKRDTRIALSIYNLANVAPRRTTTLILASADVETAAKALSSLATKLGGRVVTSSLSSDRPQQSNATLQIEVPSSSADAALAEIRAAGESISSKVAENSNRDSSTESKTGFVISIVSIEQIPPRQTLTATIESRDVAKAAEQLRAAAGGGKIVSQQLSQSSGDRASAKLVVDIPVAQLQQIVSAMSQNGTIREQSAAEDTNAPQFSGARARVDVTIITPQSIMAADDGFWHSIRSGLATSGKGLGWSLQMIVIGLCLVAPWALLVWIGARLVRRLRGRTGSSTTL